MARREREILEHAVRTIAEQAVKADELVDEAKAAGGGNHPVTVHAKMLRLELLKVKADLERELEDFSRNCSRCGLDVHLGKRPRGHTRSLGASGAGAARRAGGLVDWRWFHQLQGERNVSNVFVNEVYAVECHLLVGPRIVVPVDIHSEVSTDASTRD